MEVNERQARLNKNLIDKINEMCHMLNDQEVQINELKKKLANLECDKSKSDMESFDPDKAIKI
jgi:hypothetical protein